MYSNTDPMDNMDFLMNEDLMSPQRTVNKASSWMSPFGQLAAAMPSPPGTNMALGMDADFSPDDSMKKMSDNISAAVSGMSKNTADTNFSPSLFSPPQRKGKSRKSGYQNALKNSKLTKFPDVGSDFDSSANDTTAMSDFEPNSTSDMNTTVGIFGNSSSSASNDALNTTKVYSPSDQNIRASLIKSVFNNNDASVNIHDNGNYVNDTMLLNSSSSSSSPSTAVDTSVSENRVKCNCKKSKCLKLYCQCFAVMSYCDVSVCNCVECNNLVQFEHIRAEAIKDTKERNRSAFVVKVSDKKSHANGCTCKKSQCLKKYCECFEAYAHCGDNCKCVSCENFLGSAKLESMNNSREKKANHGLTTTYPAHNYYGLVDPTSVSLNSNYECASGSGSPGMYQTLPTIRQLQGEGGQTKGGPRYTGLPSLGTKPASMDPSMTISALADSFSRSNKRRIMYVEGEDILTRHIPMLRAIGSTSANTSVNTSINATTLAMAKGEDVTTISPIEKKGGNEPVRVTVAVAVGLDGGGNKRLAISPCAPSTNSSTSGNTSSCTSINSNSTVSPLMRVPAMMIDTPSKKARYFFEYAPQPIIVYPFFGPSCPIKMPKLIALYIIDFLGDKDLCNLSLVNKLWCSTSFDDALWE